MKSMLTSETILTGEGMYLQIAAAAPFAFHVRVSRTDCFDASPPLTWLDTDRSIPQVACRVTEQNEERVSLSVEEALIQVNRRTGEIAFRDKGGRLLTRQDQPAYGGDPDGFETAFVLAEEERLYGLGDQYDTPLMKRGHKISIRLRDNRVHAPIPFIMSTAGWALLVDSDREHEFDVGCDLPDILRVRGKQEELAFYLIADRDLAGLLDKYTKLVGSSYMLPIWAYGLSFVCNRQTTARDMIEDALKFRRDHIPCDMIGLEPTWMDKPFDYGTSINWHPDRFYIPAWMPEGAHTFLGVLQTMGFKLSLGLPLRENSDIGEPSRRDAKWYKDLERFVAQGVDGFKLCTEVQIGEQTYPPSLPQKPEDSSSLTHPGSVSRILFEGFAGQTGRRPMIYSPIGYTGIQKYAAMWSGGRSSPHLTVLNMGLSGIPHMSVAINLHTPEGIHFGFFQPWANVNSWAYWRHPTLLDQNLLDIFRKYAVLRYKLIPYIYSAAHTAVSNGLPIARAMPLAFPHDSRSDSLPNQYMFGDNLLVGVFTDRVYLPAGEWFDFWTDERYFGSSEVVCRLPAHAGGPLFVRAGSIIPMWPEMDYVGQKPLDRLELHVYPGKEGEFTLCEDDGQTFGYLQGESAITKMTCHVNEERILLEIERRKGQYAGMPKQRIWSVVFHSAEKPSAVTVDDSEWRETTAGRKGLPPDCWSYQRKSSTLRMTLNEPENQLTVRVELLYGALQTTKEKPRPDHARRTATELENKVEVGQNYKLASQVTDMIKLEIDRELRLHEIASRLHVSPAYLSRCFKRDVGLSFSDYVLEQKMALAKELLLSGSTVAVASNLTGYKETSYFIRVFRKYWGMTPGEIKL
ncbi:hypothetical protein B1748_32835 [Paenibacillus sp. MY03]|nr:hypothetical protein B1748_32835 [Paenibacillus sp. MY03]